MFKYILIISLLIIPVYANAVTVSIPDKQGTADETLDIPVNIDNASNVAGADLTITFLSSILTAQAIYTADLTSSFSVTANTNTAGEVRIALANSTGISSGSGALVNIRFKVSANASSGTSSLTLQSVTLNDESGNSITPVTTQNGTFTVSSISDFTITASPSSRLLEQGNSTTYTVTIGSVSGFNDTVNLYITGIPNNTTGSFSSSSLTPGNSTLTITAGNTATISNATLTITGISGSKIHNYNITLTILDSIAPSDISNFSITGGNAQCTLNWSNPTESDFSGLLVLRKNSAFNSDTDSPVSGTSYNAGDSIGTASIVYKGSETTKTDIGLTNGTTYYYKLYAYDEVPNYSSGETSSATPQASTGDGSGSSGGGGCFIATAAYGTPIAKEVIVLSKFRDEHLLTNPIGKRLVNFYYKYGPYVADWIRDKEMVKRITRYVLKQLVWVVKERQKES